MARQKTSDLAKRETGHFAVPWNFTWDPFRELENVRREMDQMMLSLFGRRPFGWGLPAADTSVPQMDLYETDDDLVLSVALPGISKKDINLSVTADTISIEAERKTETSERQKYHFKEQRYGAFRTSFTLPREVKPDGVKARYKNGILEVIMPKAEVSKPHQIKIEVEE